MELIPLCSDDCVTSATVSVVSGEKEETIVALTDGIDVRISHNNLAFAIEARNAQVRFDRSCEVRLPCAVCGDIVSAPVAHTKGRHYFWPGTHRKYRNGAERPYDVDENGEPYADAGASTKNLAMCSADCATVWYITRCHEKRPGLHGHPAPGYKPLVKVRAHKAHAGKYMYFSVDHLGLGPAK